MKPLAPGALRGPSRGEPGSVRRSRRWPPRQILRRIRWVAGGWAAAGVTAFLVAGQPRGALALTVAAAASIVGLRGLEGVVRRLQADPDGGYGGGEDVRFFLRLFLLVATLGVAFVSEQETTSPCSPG